ncbi:MAG: c-type cytochrome [Bacteroidetes bacterium]|nr:c-type cytochrome [Bacteroidota bacterium]
MKKTFFVLTLLTAVTTVVIFACTSSSANDAMETDPSFAFTSAQVTHGKYLVTIMGCNDCHTPLKLGAHGPESDTARMLSGHPEGMPLPPVDTNALKNWVLFNHSATAIAGPWGVSFSANLTSDPTGIGSWSLARFKKALKEGKSKGLDNNRSLLPPMPWPNYVNISDEDVTDIFAYLKSTKPVKNLVPSPIAPGGR